MKRGLAILLALLLLVTSLSVFTAYADNINTRGDVDFDDKITMKDVLLVRKFIAHIGTLMDEKAADANGDESVDMKDILLLRQYVAKWNVTLATVATTTTTGSGVTEPSATETTGATATTTGKTTYDKVYPDQITLTYYDEACSQYGVTWHTVAGGKSPTVQVVAGETADAAAFSSATMFAGTTSTHDTQTMPYDYATNTFEWAAPKNVTDYVNRAVISGLDYDTIYSYRVGDADANVWSDIATFKTRKEVTTSFTFIDITDTQAKENKPENFKYMRAALQGAYSQVSDPAFILHGGDFVERSNYMNLWQNMINGNKDFLMKTPIMSVCGNHDSTYKADAYEQISHFYVDIDETKQNTELGMYYSYDYGNAHFIVLNSNSTKEETDGVDGDDSIDQAQYDWLVADLAANTKEWTFVALHHPLYAPASTTTGDVKPVLQAQLQGLFNQYGVDVVIESHEHMYVQTYPLDATGKPLTTTATTQKNGVTYYQNPGAPIYTMAGKGGYGGDSPYGTYNESLFASYKNGQSSSWAIYKIDGSELTVTTYYSVGGSIQTYGSFGIIHQ